MFKRTVLRLRELHFLKSQHTIWKHISVVWKHISVVRHTRSPHTVTNGLFVCSEP